MTNVLLGGRGRHGGTISGGELLNLFPLNNNLIKTCHESPNPTKAMCARTSLHLSAAMCDG